MCNDKRPGLVFILQHSRKAFSGEKRAFRYVSMPFCSDGHCMTKLKRAYKVCTSQVDTGRCNREDLIRSDNPEEVEVLVGQHPCIVGHTSCMDMDIRRSECCAFESDTESSMMLIHPGPKVNGCKGPGTTSKAFTTILCPS